MVMVPRLLVLLAVGVVPLGYGAVSDLGSQKDDQSGPPRPSPGFSLNISKHFQNLHKKILSKFLELEDDRDLDDYDRSHPVNITVQDHSTSGFQVSWNLPASEPTDDLDSFELEYYKRKDKSAPHLKKVLSANQTSIHLTGLESGTWYSFRITAVYESGHRPKSRVTSVLVEGCGDDRREELDHYDRSHAVNITVLDTTESTLDVSWALPREEDPNELHNYIVEYYKTNNREEFDYRRVVAYNVSHIHVEGLDSGTKYSVIVIANYTTCHLPRSRRVTIWTAGYGPDRDCNCNKVGTKSNTSYLCSGVNPECQCRNNLTIGPKCDSCVDGYYFHDRIGCDTCPCNQQRGKGDGTCSTENNVLVCNCYSPYGGPRCNSCVNGYYRSPSNPDDCIPCHCNGNSEKNASDVCDVNTGVCHACAYNTTGDSCEKCLPDYMGDAVHGKNCTLIVDVYGFSAQAHQKRQHHFTVLGVFLALAGILLVVMIVLAYRRCYNRNQPFKFWTVELRDNHEQVNFSSMADQPDYHRIDGTLQMDDSPYFDSSAPRSIVKQPVRAKLGMHGYKSLNDRAYRA